MANVVPITQRQSLSAEHRGQLTRIHSLCIDISLATGDMLEYRYNGVTHALHLTRVLAESRSHRHGGDNSYLATWSASVYLPPRNDGLAGDTTHELNRIVEYLTALLPSTPGGAA